MLTARHSVCGGSEQLDIFDRAGLAAEFELRGAGAGYERRGSGLFLIVLAIVVIVCPATTAVLTFDLDLDLGVVGDLGTELVPGQGTTRPWPPSAGGGDTLVVPKLDRRSSIQYPTPAKSATP